MPTISYHAHLFVFFLAVHAVVMSGGKGPLSPVPGTSLSCTTTLGTTIKGTVMATDESFGAIVLSKTNPLTPNKALLAKFKQA